MPVRKCYTTNHQISQVVMNAYAEGCGGQIVAPHKLQNGPAAMYGILRGTGDILKQCETIHREYHYIDHGYFKSGHFNGYYRITENAMQRIPEPSSDDRRFRSLGIEVSPWRKTGRDVLIAPPSRFVADFHGIDMDQWVQLVSREIALHTDRPVKMREKPDAGSSRDEMAKGFDQALDDCWCLVAYHSIGALEALVQGVPVIVLGESCCEPMSWTWKNLESPIWPEREPYFHDLSNHQFTLDEMRSGHVVS